MDKLPVLGFSLSPCSASHGPLPWDLLSWFDDGFWSMFFHLLLLTFLGSGVAQCGMDWPGAALTLF